MTATGSNLRTRARRLAVAGGVVLAHAGLYAVLALTHVAPPPTVDLPVVDVELIRPLTPPPPPPPPEKPQPPALVSGGGAPAAPSRIHAPPTPKPQTPELPAPVVQAPKPDLVIGIAPSPSPTPGMGLGGQGTGTGTGNGDGDGPGSGGPPRFIAGPSSRQIADAASPQAKRARVDGMVNLRCTIRLDTRLENCRVINETPQGMGFGAAAVRVATEHFRFSPPTTGSGRPVVGAEMPLGIRFNLGGRRAPEGPLEG